SDDRQSAEWNTAALGPSKRACADELIRRFRQRFAPGGLLHDGQGKWYPGESLPRWAFGLYWRRDGKPMWHNAALIAFETAAHRPLAEDAQRFTHAVARRLGLDASYVQPAFEDPLERMRKEGALPENIDPSDPKIDDPIERDRIKRAFEQPLGAPAGYVLPVQPWKGHARLDGLSELWQTRRGRLFLLPGEAPIGSRLPLKALSYLRPADYPQVVPPDPAAARGALPDPQELAQAMTARSDHATTEKMLQSCCQSASAFATSPGPGVSVRTALTVEPRDGRLCVFMPPLERLEDYLELLAAVGSAAGELDTTGHVEGYEPPGGPRLKVLKVTPAPRGLDGKFH